MSTPFDRASDRMNLAIERARGELFTLQPRRRQSNVNLPLEADPTRDVVTFSATWSDGFARAGAEHKWKGGAVSSERPGHISTRPVIGCRASALPYRPRIGDVVVRQSDSSGWEVSEPRMVGLDWYEIDLNRA